MKIFILAILVLLTLGCSTTKNNAQKDYFAEEVQFGYTTTTIAYSSEEEKRSVIAFVKQF